MHQATHLPPLQRDALREMLRSPSHSLVREGGNFVAHHQRAATSGTQQVRVFTKRLVRMLDRAALVDLDDADFLTRKGLQLAEQIKDVMALEAAQAVERG